MIVEKTWTLAYAASSSKPISTAELAFQDTLLPFQEFLKFGIHFLRRRVRISFFG